MEVVAGDSGVETEFDIESNDSSMSGLSGGAGGGGAGAGQAAPLQPLPEVVVVMMFAMLVIMLSRQIQGKLAKTFSKPATSQKNLFPLLRQMKKPPQIPLNPFHQHRWLDLLYQVLPIIQTIMTHC